MGQTAIPTRHNRTITVDFHDETTYFALLDNTQAFVDFVLAFLLLCEFARKKENPSLERFIASPFELCIASLLLTTEALSTLKSFSAERPVMRGRGRSHALKLLIRS